MKYNIILAAMLLTGTAIAQPRTDWTKPLAPSEGRSEPRSEFVGYDTRPEAEKGVRKNATFYRPLELFQTNRDGALQFRTVVDIPILWIDRDIFLHVEGLPEFSVEIDGCKVGRSTDSAVPTEFNVSQEVKDGLNNIAIEVVAGGAGEALDNVDSRAVKAYIYGQPKCRIEDFSIKATPDSTKKFGMLYLDIALENTQNTPQTVQVGYDIYSPEGKLMRYNYRDMTLEAHSRDTVRYEQEIYGGVMDRLWSAASPKQFNVMLYMKRDGRMVEYIPFKTGFIDRSFTPENGLLVRGKKVAIKAVEYDGAATETLVAADFAKLKKAGINTIVTLTPQPYWFYDLCDKTGFYVIDAININSEKYGDNPLYVNYFTERVASTYQRNKNHTCIIAWSLGHSPNGYNMQKAYQALKAIESERPVIYDGAAGDWNSDMAMPAVESASKYLKAEPKSPPPPRRR